MKKISGIKLDPTRTGLLRMAFVADVTRRMNAIRRAVVQLVDTEDAFGIRGNSTAPAPAPGAATVVSVVPHAHFLTANTRWQFETDDKKIAAYQGWLKGEVDKNLLTVDPANKDTPWVQPYIGKAYKKGMERAYTDTSPKGEDLSFIEGGKTAFMKMAFEGPVGQTKLRTLSTRAFTNLKGISVDMDKQMTTILATGLAKGTGPRELGKQLAESVDGLSKTRAATIARTEVVHAHNEGQLDSFEAMNVEGVGVMAEWSTAHDGQVCPQCSPLEGVILKIAEARGLLPRHPNCRCAWIPAGVGEQEHGGTTETTWAGDEQGLEEPGTEPTGKTTGQVWSKDEVSARIRESLAAETGLKGAEAREASTWLGADTKITGKLKPGTKAYLETKAAEKAAAQQAATAAKEAAEKAAAEKAAARKAALELKLAEEKAAAEAAAKAVAEAAAQAAKEAAEKAAAEAAAKKTEEAAKAVAKWSGTGYDVAALDHADYTHLFSDSSADGWGWGPPQGGKKQSYGTIIFDDQGRVLMREPKNHFGGAHWTFAKGGGTKPGTTALMELGEETGHKAAIFDYLPGGYKGTTSKTNYFLGKSIGYDAGLMDAETESVKWMTFDEANKAIALSKDALVIARDQEVLAAAYAQVAESDGAGILSLATSGQAKLDEIQKEAAAAQHSHKVKVGMAQKHFAKDKFGGGVLPEDFTSPTKQKLADSGINKMLSEKGWHLGTVANPEAFTLADDIVGQKAAFDKLKYAPKGVPKIALATPAGPVPVLPTEEGGYVAFLHQKLANAPASPKAPLTSGGKLTEKGMKELSGVTSIDGLAGTYSDLMDAQNLEEQIAIIAKFNEKNGVKAMEWKPAAQAKAATVPLPAASQPWHVKVGLGDMSEVGDFPDPKVWSSTALDNAVEKGGNLPADEAYDEFKKWHKTQKGAKAFYDMDAAEIAEHINTFKTAHPQWYPVVSGPAPVPTFAVPFEADLKKVRDLPGSTKPYLAEDPTGKKWVVKDVSGSGIAPAHLRSEATADELYRTLGFDVPKGKIQNAAGGPMKITEYLEGQTLAQWKAGKTPAEIKAMYKEIQKGFVADALFANHDVAGLSFDNIYVHGGKPYRIDNGGALAFRAQGGKKATWGPTVTELASMKDKSINAVTGDIYAGITDKDIHDQIRHIVANRANLLAAVEDDGVRSVLAARIDDLEARLPAQAARKAAPGGPRAAEYGVTPQTAPRVQKARSNGVNIAIDRADIEDTNALAWEEKDIHGKPVTAIQFKVTPGGSKKIAEALGDEFKTANKMSVSAPAGVHPNDSYFKTVADAAKTTNKHVADGAYNTGFMEKLDTAQSKIDSQLATYKATYKAGVGITPQIQSTIDMLEHYQTTITAIKEAQKTKNTVAPVTQFVLKPPEPAAGADAGRRLRRDIRVRRDDGIAFRTATFKNGVGTEKDAKTVISIEGGAYLVDMGEGIQVHYVPHPGKVFTKYDNEAGQALFGTVRVTLPAAPTPETLNKAMGMLQELGLQTAAPTPAFEESLYLHKGVYLNKKADNAGYMAIWENKNITDEEKVAQQKKWILDNMKIDVTKAKEYDPVGISKHSDGTGYRYWKRWDLPEAQIEKEMPKYTLYHGVSGTGESDRGDVPESLAKILGSGGELTSTTGRIRKGVPLSAGASSGTDINSGGASYIFTRIKEPDSPMAGFHFKIKNLARMDTISYDEDKYGSIASLDQRHTTTAKFKHMAKYNSGNESIFKEGLSIIDDIDHIVVYDTAEKGQTLKAFADHGITTLPDGRAVGDVVLTKDEKRAKAAGYKKNVNGEWLP